MSTPSRSTANQQRRVVFTAARLTSNCLVLPTAIYSTELRDLGEEGSF